MHGLKRYIPMILFVAPFVASCTSDDPGGDDPPPACTADDECAGETPLCDVDAGVCGALPAGHQIGWRDGAAATVAIVPIYDPGGVFKEATDLEFHPTRTNELWVTLRALGSSEAVCTQGNTSGCLSLEGEVLIITNPGHPTDGIVETTVDPNAWHFMRRPPAIAMGAGDTWGTCGDFRTGNFTDEPIDYIGPALFSSDRSIWSFQPPGKNGSHLDMLHASPFCVGIAWERDNVYWVFNGNAGSIDRYDFATPHEIGGEDHSNGELRRFALGQLLRTPNVPGHMVFNPTDGQLYVADTGHGRIVRLDPASGAAGGTPSPIYEELASAQLIEGATLVDVVPPGTLVAPSGLHIKDGVIFVTDNATSAFYAFDLDGTLLRKLQTTLQPGTLAGLTIGPDDKVYFVDRLTSFVHRLDPL